MYTSAGKCDSLPYVPKFFVNKINDNILYCKVDDKESEFVTTYTTAGSNTTYTIYGFYEITEELLNTTYLGYDEVEDDDDLDKDEPYTDNLPVNPESTAEEETPEMEGLIAEFHPGTVDNPFLYGASTAKLEKFLLTNVFVAGKNATIQQQKLDQFVECVKRDLGSYAVEHLGVMSAINNGLISDEMKDKVTEWLKEVKSGQYSRICGFIESYCNKTGHNEWNLKVTNRSGLVALKGVGYKTASMFLMYTRKDLNVACLDTHILKHLAASGVPNVPASTPTSKDDYVRLEKEFLKQAKTAGKHPAVLDFEIWSQYRQKIAVEAPIAETVEAAQPEAEAQPALI